MAKIKKEQILGTNFSYTGHRLSYWFESMKRLDVSRVEFYGCAPHCYLYDVTPQRAFSISRQLKETGSKYVFLLLSSAIILFPQQLMIIVLESALWNITKEH